MTTDPTPDRVAAAPADATEHLVERAVRPIDIEHDDLMARAAAEHQARVTADQARAADDRAAAYQLAADTIERMQGYPHLILPEEIVSALRLLATGAQPEPGSPAYTRRLAAGERDEQQAQQGDATILAELQQHLTDHTPSCNARTDHLMRRAAWALGMPRPAHVGGNAEKCPGCEGTNPPYPFICPQPEPAAAPVAGQPPADTGEEAAPPVCEGFQWIGQSFATCDRCAQPAWDHAGEDVAAEGAGPFDNERTVRPWKPGEADAIRAKWAPTKEA